MINNGSRNGKEPMLRIGQRIYFAGRNRRITEQKFVDLVQELEKQRGKLIAEEFFNITIEQRIAEEFNVSISTAEIAYKVYNKFMRK